MTKIQTNLAFGILCLAISPLAHADTVLTLDGNFAAPDYAFYSYTDTLGDPQGATPVGPYITTMNDNGIGNIGVLTICYDFKSDTPIGTNLSGMIEPVSYFTGSAYTEIMESTYLVNELMEGGGLNASLANRGALAFAIWELMNPSSTTSISPFPSDPASQAYESQAALAVSSSTWTAADANLYPTWVPANPAYQRFAIISEAPEPPTMVLMVLGLLGFAFVWSRSRGLALNAVKK